MHDQRIASTNGEPGMVGKMMIFLRNDIAEIRSATERLRETSNGLFGPPSGKVADVSPSGPTPSHAVAELEQLMYQCANARDALHDEVHRLTQAL